MYNKTAQYMRTSSAIDFVPPDLTIKLSEMGIWKNVLFHGNYSIWPHPIELPLWQQAFDFMREKHGLHAVIDCRPKYYTDTQNLVWDYYLKEGNSVICRKYEDKAFPTYAEARNASLVAMIEHVKNNHQQ